jgi:ABC-type multidrug transport system ATPase subunit
LLTATNLEYNFKNSDNGIKKFNFQAKSGQLVGIMGGSGVGKSTLLNILNGSLKPHSGKVMINGVDIYEEKVKLQGIIGYIPQDDFLVEELTVFQNLYFNARFCYNSLTEDETYELIESILKDLDLQDIKNLKVGTPLNKFISGGQRKRLNIALELLREPYILFVDEPTSGLSSNDSEKVIDLLKNQTYKGKLVIVNIHQPSSDIFKMFDSLLVLDKGGRPVYYGNAIDSVVYFKTATQLVNATESECIWCGNINPEQILQIIETGGVDIRGKITGDRMVLPEEWYQLYLGSIDKNLEININKHELPPTNFKLPGKIKQFMIYSYRNLLTKFSDKQYLFINLLEAPVLAFILGYFTKYAVGTNKNPKSYVFSENLNLPAFLFMSVVVALFIGMMVSAEEIIRDAKLLKRESFLNLSKVSYFNSKVIYLIGILGFQMFVYVFIGNHILEIKGMTFIYWIILFSAAVFAGILGLNISGIMKSVVAIYILIPLMLIPQLLLSGVIVKFDKLHSILKSEIYVPLIGDIMASRWAYESLSVTQFRDNQYQKKLYDIEKNISDATYCTNFWVPELLNRLNECETFLDSTAKKKQLEKELSLLHNEFLRLAVFLNIEKFNKVDKLKESVFNIEISGKAKNYLRYVRSLASAFLNNAIHDEDIKIQNLQKKAGGQGEMQSIKDLYYNNSLADQVLNKNESEKIIEYNNRLYRKFEPIYTFPESKNGRAHFYAPYKQLGNFLIDTVWFNIAILWLISFIFYIILISNLVNRIIRYFTKYF